MPPLRQLHRPLRQRGAALRLASPPRPGPRPARPRRREALAALGCGVLAFRLLASAAAGACAPTPGLIRPPGARAEADFLNRCLRCGACMKVCMRNAIHPALHEAGWEGASSPRLMDFESATASTTARSAARSARPRRSAACRWSRSRSLRHRPRGLRQGPLPPLRLRHALHRLRGALPDRREGDRLRGAGRRSAATGSRSAVKLPGRARAAASAAGSASRSARSTGARRSGSAPITRAAAAAFS